jgi:amino acid transporter
MAADDAGTITAAQPAVGAAAERRKLRRALGRMDTVFFLISAMVVVDTIGAIAVGGGQTFTWLAVLFVTFFIPSALASAELGAVIPEGGGVYPGQQLGSTGGG